MFSANNEASVVAPDLALDRHARVLAEEGLDLIRLSTLITLTGARTSDERHGRLRATSQKRTQLRTFFASTKVASTPVISDPSTKPVPLNDSYNAHTHITTTITTASQPGQQMVEAAD